MQFNSKNALGLGKKYKKTRLIRGSCYVRLENLFSEYILAKCTL